MSEADFPYTFFNSLSHAHTFLSTVHTFCRHVHIFFSGIWGQGFPGFFSKVIFFTISESAAPSLLSKLLLASQRPLESTINVFCEAKFTGHYARARGGGRAGGGCQGRGRARRITRSARAPRAEPLVLDTPSAQNRSFWTPLLHSLHHASRSIFDFASKPE